MAKLAPGWIMLSVYVLKSPEGKSTNYTQYREITGLCEECGQPMATHPKCEACSILAGPDHFVYCFSYRGHDICGYCQSAWGRLDQYLERVTTWEEFLHSGKLTAEILSSRKATKMEFSTSGQESC